MIEKYCKQNLEELSALILQMKSDDYKKPLDSLSGSSIGQHIRHIVEFYQCLHKGLYSTIVNYDRRERELQLENDIRFAVYTIDKIRTNIFIGMEDFSMTLKGDFSDGDGTILLIGTSFYRELAYCLEHSIHHQALIKIGLIELKNLRLIDENFGVAPATIRFRKVNTSA